MKTDRMFLFLLLGQWALAIGVALVFSPAAWAGKVKTVHFHLQMAIVFGAIVNALPIALIILRPGSALTRHVVAAAQMLWSALLIQLTGGRIETHFHVFGSLAFLAYYRDWRLLITATLFVAGDHLFRGLMWPESVYGVANPEWWRFLEHAWWVAFENVVLAYGCVRGVRETRAMAEREASLEDVNFTIEREVRVKTAALRTNVERYKLLVESTNSVPWEIDSGASAFSYIAPQASRLFGFALEQLDRMSLVDLLHPADRERVVASFAAVAEAAGDGDGELDLEYRIVRADQAILEVRSVVTARRNAAGRVAFRGITFDVTRQKKLERELHQSQKLESVGRLAAGVAHEINTPIQFVSDSLHFVRDAMHDLTGLVGKYRILQPETMAAAEEEADLDYVLDNVPKALDRSLDGLQRVTTIVRSMKEFAHPDQRDMALADINQAIQSTIIIATNECKYVADVVTDLGDLPLVRCFRGGLNQAILNILVNAAHAIGDVVRGTSQRGRISVLSRRDHDHVVIEISDTGGGIPEAIQSRIFDPFFTTKDVGRGTGQGLAIARAVLETHGGQLTFDTEAGRGTTFYLRMPIAGPAAAGAAA